jgi:hypothetical protein
VPNRPGSIRRHTSPPPRKRAPLVALLIALAVAFCGFVALGSASRSGRRVPKDASATDSGERDLSIAPLRLALAHLLVTNGPGTQAPSEPAEPNRRARQAEPETTQAPSENEEARQETEVSEPAERSPQTEDPDRRDDLAERAARFEARMRRMWRAFYYARYAQYWNHDSYQSPSEEEEDGDPGSTGGWAIPGGIAPPESQAPVAGGGNASSCPLAQRRWLVRLQGRPISTGPGAGLVCLTGANAGSPGADRLSLLAGLVRLISRASPRPARVALVVHGTSLGVLVPPPRDGDSTQLPTNLGVVGLGDGQDRAAAVARALDPRRIGSGKDRTVVSVDPELSLVLMDPGDLAGVIASEHDGSALRRSLGVADTAALGGTKAGAHGDTTLVPALPANAAIGVELDGCPPPSGDGDLETVSSALCVGDGKLVGGSEGHTATMFYEVETARDPARASAS